MSGDLSSPPRRAFLKIPVWVWLWSACLLFVINIPYLGALLNTPEETVLTGVLVNEADNFSYLANMQIGANGGWLYSHRYTAERSAPVPMFMSYILSGKLANALGLSMPFMFHFTRVLFGVLSLLAGYAFIAYVLKDEREQKIAFALLAFTLGWNWFFAIFGRVLFDAALDLWITEAFGSLIIFFAPHYPLALLFMLWMIWRGEQFIREGAARHGFEAALAGALLVFVHSFQLAVTDGVLLGLVAWAIWEQKRLTREIWGMIGRLALITAPSAIMTLIYYLMINRDSLLKNWSQQFGTPSPFPLQWFVVYGFSLIAAIVGLVYILQKLPNAEQKRFQVVAVWLLLVPILIYLPLSFQRRFAEGWYLPISILAAVGWARWLKPSLEKRLSGGKTRALGLAAFGFMAFGLPFFVLANFVRVANQDEILYMPTDIHTAITWLDANSDLETVVLAGEYHGNQIPAFSAARTLLGHKEQTAFYADRLADVQTFFAGETSEAERQTILQSLGVDYVFYGEIEKSLGDFRPEQTEYLQVVYHNPTVSIYAVVFPVSP